MKGTATRGKRAKHRVHVACRRCGYRAYHIRKRICAQCGYGKSARMRTYAWQKK